MNAADRYVAVSSSRWNIYADRALGAWRLPKCSQKILRPIQIHLYLKLGFLGLLFAVLSRVFSLLFRTHVLMWLLLCCLLCCLIWYSSFVFTFALNLAKSVNRSWAAAEKYLFWFSFLLTTIYIHIYTNLLFLAQLSAVANWLLSAFVFYARRKLFVSEFN